MLKVKDIIHILFQLLICFSTLIPWLLTLIPIFFPYRHFPTQLWWPHFSPPLPLNSSHGANSYFFYQFHMHIKMIHIGALLPYGDICKFSINLWRPRTRRIPFTFSWVLGDIFSDLFWSQHTIICISLLSASFLSVSSSFLL